MCVTGIFKSAKERYTQSEMLRRISRNFGWLFFDKILRMGVGMLVGIWIARYLGPDQFGAFSYATAYASIFGSLAGLGLDSIVVRDIVNAPQRTAELLGTAFSLKFIGGILVVLLSTISIHFSRPNDDTILYLVLIASTGTIFQSLNAIDFYFQSKVMSKFTVLAQGAAFVICTLTKIVLLTMKAPLIAFAAVGLAEIVLGSLFLALVYFYNRQNIFNWLPSRNMAIKLIRESWPLVISSFAIMLFMRIDQIILGNTLGNKVVGNYNAAIKVGEVWNFVAISISSTAYPALIEAKKKSETTYLLRLEQLFRLMVVITLPVALFMTFAADEILGFLYGSQYQGAGSVLKIQIWGGIFVFFGVIGSNFLIIEGLTKVYFYRAILSFLINISLNLILIPRLGMIGAAWAGLLTYMLGFSFDLLNKGTHRLMVCKLKAFIPRI